MFGIHVQNLTVTVGGSQKFEKIGNQGQEWHCGVIDVTDQSGKIAFNAYRSVLPYSVIALDYFQVLYSDTCGQENCVKLVASSTTRPETNSIASPTFSTTDTELSATSATSASGGVSELLPIAIGVPCGVLIVGAIVVDVRIHKRQHSKKVVGIIVPIGSNNLYDTTPRKSGVFDNEEIYNELNEDAMIDNDKPSYDEIGNVELRQEGTADTSTTNQKDHQLRII